MSGKIQVTDIEGDIAYSNGPLVFEVNHDGVYQTNANTPHTVVF